MGGLVQGGTAAASSITAGFLGVSVVCGLMDTIGAGRKIWSGYCEAADGLDGHADKFCAMLRMMREIARGTEVHKRLTGKLPRMVLLEIQLCKLPKPDLRFGDRAKKRITGISRAQVFGRTYFKV